MLQIEVLGPGCPRCHSLENNVRAAVQEMGIEAEIRKISAIKDIAARKVMMTPALVVGGRVVSSGHLLTVRQVRELLEKEGVAQATGADRPGS